MVSPATTTASGWVSLGASSSNSRSGYGWSHGTSGEGGSDGTRRRLLRSASRQALVAIRYSQARNPGPALEAVTPAPGAQEGLLDRVLGDPGVVARWAWTGLRVRAWVAAR
jgi:hypothetical protein